MPRHRLILAALLLLPLWAASAAHADSEAEHVHSDTGSHDSGGDHHDSGGDGHNDDGSLQFTTSASSVMTGINATGTGSGSINGEHRRFGDIVASPTLDPQQTKAAIAGGKAASMPLLLAYLNQNYPGQLLDVKLHSDSDGFVYEVRYLSNVVFLRTLFLDAATLKAK